MILAERIDGSLNHLGKIAPETVGCAGRAESRTLALAVTVVCERALGGCESGQHVVLDASAGLPVGTPHCRSKCLVSIGYRRGIPCRTECLHACESSRKRVDVADALFRLSTLCNIPPDYNYNWYAR